jgi:3D (Asp-Asp-Asp) domain-containing protein
MVRKMNRGLVRAMVALAVLLAVSVTVLSVLIADALLKGENGARESKYINRATLGTITVEKPVEAEVAKVETKEFIGNYKLTWYNGDAKGIGTHGASGEKLIPGVSVAVNPKVIPYGTRIYIEGYGEFIAHDTGIAPAKGQVIDIFVAKFKDVPTYGIDYADVYIIRE